MIKRITLTNYRKFEKYAITLKPGNIIVGPNNAGKSAIIDSLRVLEACLNYSSRLKPQLLPLEDSDIVYGYDVPDGMIPINLSHSTYNYNNNDARLEFEIRNGTKAVILLNPKRVTRFFLVGDDIAVASRAKFKKEFPIDLVIVPTLSPLEREERLVKDETIRKSEATRTSSRHLRNVWFRRSDADFEAFSSDVNSAWPGIIIRKPERDTDDLSILHMYYEEHRITREVQWSGFGFQIWLQILTHLRRAKTEALVVIDEPDIYLHPDIQRRLIRLVRERFSQFIFATHSVEMINEAEPLEIASVNSRYRTAKRISSETDYNKIYGYLGSTQNVDIARISKARRVVFVEGEDKRIYKVFSQRASKKNLADGTVPFVRLGGFEGWQRAVAAVWAFKEILGTEIDVFCLFDRDYRCDEEVDAFRKKLAGEKMKCHVLEKKEIENYLLDPAAIALALARRNRGNSDFKLGQSEVESELIRITDAMKHRVLGRRSASQGSFFRESRSAKSEATVSEDASKRFEDKWSILPDRLGIVPGKETLSSLNERFEKLGVGSLTHRMIIEAMSMNDLGDEVGTILTELDEFCRMDQNF